jgi:predicted metal-dependent HD superfamily phosphohydrolase
LEEYEKQVRDEYSHVLDLIFRQKRREILEGFLSRPFLYHTDYYRSRLEKAARENLCQSIVRLKEPISKGS